MDYNIQMVDLKQQYLRLKEDIDLAIFDTIQKSQFINGHNFNNFQIIDGIPRVSPVVFLLLLAGDQQRL
jgi:hypothetical protein